MSELERSPSGRKLQLRARAIRQSKTRESITQAAVELHEQLGPLHTSITAIAARAGVERLTVYRHFPDEASLHQACQQHFFAAHPLPNLSAWRDISSLSKRLEIGLTDLYEYWGQTHDMFASVLRDYEVDPERSGAGIVTFMAEACNALLDGQMLSGHRGRMLRATVGHAVHFYTWRSLVQDQGLSNTEATNLMRQIITRVTE